MRRLYAILPLILLSVTALQAQEFDTVRVCTYNILRYQGSDLIHHELRIILNEVRPDILLVQELYSESAYDRFFDSVATRLEKPLAGFGFFGLFQTNHYSAVFFNPELFHPVNGGEIEDYSNILTVGQLVHHASGDTIDVYSNQWEANQGSNNQEITRRFSARNFKLWRETDHEDFEHAPFFLYGGTLNCLGSEDAGYQSMAQPDTGTLIDPIARAGLWHDNEEFADLHTSSTRVREIGVDDTGGLRDRFDQILISRSLRDRYVPGSYTTFGNDGAHFRDSINAQPNLAVDPAMAQALHDASDHLPVYLDLLFPRVSTDVPFIASPYPLDLADVSDK